MKATFFIQNLLLLLILFIAESSWSQQSMLDTLQSKFELHRSSKLTEKIFIHTDRNTYVVGEKIWFKAYLTDGTLHKPLDFSKVAYLEILDNTNGAVLQTMIAITKGFGDGSLMLPMDLRTGSYLLRAYTSWMKNFSPDFFYQQSITILNPFSKSVLPAGDTLQQISVQFFPEGGTLTAGWITKIGFQGVNKTGKGVGFKGILVTDQQDTVAAFSPLVFGIGSFSFQPKPSTRYKAIITDQRGNISSHDFPSVRENDYALSVREVDSIVQIHIYKPQQALGPTSAYLLIHARNSIILATQKFLKSDTAVYSISKSKFPEGISHITLFNKDLKPVCERLYFKQPEDRLDITIALNANTFINREKIKLEFDTRFNDQPVISNFSVSVFLDDSLNAPITNISTYHLLTSDLKGTIENPEYYLNTESSDIKEAINNLMLTHGWRRFKWEDVLESKQALTFLPELRSPLLQAIIETTKGEAIPNDQVYLSLRQNPSYLYSATSNAAGQLFFEIPHLSGSSILYLQQKKSDSTVVLRVLSPFYKGESNLLAPTGSFNTTNKKSIRNRSIASQVMNSFAKETFITTPNDTTAFYGQADEIYYLDDYTRFPVMEEVMREYVKAVIVKRKKNGFNVIVANRGAGGMFTESPLMLLDGVPLVNENELMSLDPLQIKKVEVVSRRYFYGRTSYAGIISLSSITRDSEVALHPNHFQFDYEGLQKQRVFYSPQYKTNTAYKDRKPDQRTLLYWNPTVITNSAGNTTLEFYTSDISGKFKIIVEGLSKNGQSGSKEIIFDVTNR